MTRRGRTAVALGVSGALATAGVAAAAVTPPPGTPDLAAMALAAGDLAPGTVAAPHQGYVAPVTGFTAEYDAGFTTASTTDGVSYYSIGEYISIAPSASVVSTFFNAETAFFRSKHGHKLLDKVIAAAAGRHAHLRSRNIRYEVGGSLGVGTASFLETIGLRDGHTGVHEDVVLFSQGTVYVLLVMTANPGEQIPRSDAATLAAAIDTHIDTVLATPAGGSAGPSGGTGSSS
jgi:hypothetical protein